MTDMWFEEELLPDITSLAHINKKGIKLSEELSQMSRIRRRIRFHRIRNRLLNNEEVELVSMNNPAFYYLLVRLGCEFDPGRKAKATFESATFTVILRGNKEYNPHVHSLFPIEINKGESRTVAIKLGPSITAASGAGFSLGEVETNLQVGQVAPVLRGFAGEDEQTPYWVLEHHREALLFGIRHFWLLLEIPKLLSTFHIGCRVESYLQTRLGRLLMVPEKRSALDRPFETINIDSRTC